MKNMKAAYLEEGLSDSIYQREFVMKRGGAKWTQKN